MAGLSIGRGIERPVLGAFERETVKTWAKQSVYGFCLSPGTVAGYLLPFPSKLQP